jgi:site-specific recombinase
MARQACIDVLQEVVAAVRPDSDEAEAAQVEHVNQALLALCAQPEQRERLREAARLLLAAPGQQAFFAEAGLHSAMGFALELATRIGQRLLPLPPESGSHAELVYRIFTPADQRWLAFVTDETWSQVLGAVAPAAGDEAYGAARTSLAEAARMLSYRLAGCALDRELLRADAALERHESPFLALNALLVPWLDRLRAAGPPLSSQEGRDAEVLLEQCEAALARVRRRLREIGVSIRLT